MNYWQVEIIAYVLLNVVEYKMEGNASNELEIQMAIMVPKITHLDSFGLKG